MEQLVDPDVSLQKFNQELAQYRKLEDEHLKRGWWMLKAEFPEVFVVLAAPQLKPPSVIFGVVIHFANYDFWPPSVCFVDPFTRKPLRYSQMGNRLRRLSLPEGENGVTTVGDLIQAHVDDKPFLCLPGVREYHDHPAHTGDSWLLHRDNGEGSLFFLLDKIYLYGVQSIKSYNIMLQVGFNLEPQM